MADRSGRSTGGPAPWWRAPSRGDAAIAAALAALIQLEYHIDYAQSADVTPAHVAVGLAMTVPLAWRRVAPVPVGLGVVALFCLQPELLRPTPNTATAAVCLVVASASLALYPRSWWVAGGAGAAAVALGAIGAWLDPDPKGLEVVSLSLTILGSWAAGALLRRQTERARRSEALIVTERLAAEAQARELVQAERGRIARELHDVISHGLGVVVLQARGGRRMLPGDLDRAKAAFDDLEHAASEGLREMRLLLDVLRVAPGEVDDPEPQPGLNRLDDLLDGLRSAGQAIDLTIDGSPGRLSSGLDVSAYRIVQESLTNVARHAPGARARVGITYAPQTLTILVEDDGPAVERPRVGHGLVGMAERAHLYGGHLEWGPRTPHGFRVQAVLNRTEAPS